jgi:hypothetical protein
MVIKTLDRLLDRGNRFVGHRYIYNTEDKRERLLRFRESFNRADLQRRTQLAAQMSKEASYDIPQEIGFKLVDGSVLPETPEMIRQATSLVEENDLDAIRINKKAQLLTGLLKPKDLSPESPFVKFALRKDIISSVTKYLGVVPVINRIDVWYSQASPELADTQMHHLDWEGRSQVKLFLYVTDVTEEHGPFVAMAANDSATVRERINYRVGQNIPDEIVDNALAERNEMKAIGSKGSMIFVDTSRCFHYGSRVKTKAASRTVVLIQYLRPQSYALSLDYHKNNPYGFLATPEMEEYQRMVLGAE